jgi:hypothetical protein
MTRHLTSPLTNIGLFLALLCTEGNAADAAPKLERFDGQITRAQLERYLSRAVTMEGLLHEHGDLNDEVRFLKRIGARFAGRAVYSWGGERGLEPAIEQAKLRERKLHAALPELMLQAAIFEIVSEDAGMHSVPAWVFKEFGVSEAPRKFSYEAMLYPDGKFRNNWRKGASVPDIAQPETQMWFYYLAVRYIDLGVEAIHFGQVELMGRRDRKREAWDSLLARVRAYAKTHARRGIVLCDAHVPSGGILVGGRLLFDFHSFPLRIAEVPDRPLEGELRKGYKDSLYGRSKGGTTPSGWTCEHLPYLVELDNFGRSRREGKQIRGAWIWGYDEISWFARMPRPERGAWLRYASKWVRDNDPDGYLQMPGSRTLAVPVEGKNWYWASNPGPGCPTGFGDEDAIREIWSEAERAAGKSAFSTPASSRTINTTTTAMRIAAAIFP